MKHSELRRMLLGCRGQGEGGRGRGEGEGRGEGGGGQRRVSQPEHKRHNT